MLCQGGPSRQGEEVGRNNRKKAGWRNGTTKQAGPLSGRERNHFATGSFRESSEQNSQKYPSWITGSHLKFPIYLDCFRQFPLCSCL
jgi:hypothetical protein